MEKLTLSIQDKERIEWVKDFVRTNNTSVSRLFEDYISSLMAFERAEVKLSDTLKALRQPGKRPGPGEIDRHLTKRRYRSSAKK